MERTLLSRFPTACSGAASFGKELPTLTSFPSLWHTQDGHTPLHEASGKGHVEVVEALVAAGAHLNAKANVGNGDEASISFSEVWVTGLQ